MVRTVQTPNAQPDPRTRIPRQPPHSTVGWRTALWLRSVYGGLPSSLHVAELLEAFGEGPALAQRGADLCLGAGQLLAAGEHGLDVFRRHDENTVVVGQHEVAGADLDRRRRRAGQLDRLLPTGHPPPADGLDRGAVAGEHREAVLAQPAHVPDAGVEQRTRAAAFCHAERDQLTEVADALAATGPHRHLVRADLAAGLHLGRVTGAGVGGRLAGDRVRPPGEPLTGQRPDVRVQSLVRQPAL